MRHDLANMKQRLRALEAKVAEDLIMAESQVQALDDACGEIETAHPGHLGSQETFYVGTFNGAVGFISSLR